MVNNLSSRNVDRMVLFPSSKLLMSFSEKGLTGCRTPQGSERLRMTFVLFLATLQLVQGVASIAATMRPFKASRSKRLKTFLSVRS